MSWPNIKRPVRQTRCVVATSNSSTYFDDVRSTSCRLPPLRTSVNPRVASQITSLFFAVLCTHRSVVLQWRTVLCKCVVVCSCCSIITIKDQIKTVGCGWAAQSHLKNKRSLAVAGLYSCRLYKVTSNTVTVIFVVVFHTSWYRMFPLLPFLLCMWPLSVFRIRGLRSHWGRKGM